MQVGVITWPTRIKLCSPGAFELINQVTVRIENAQGWDLCCFYPLLSPRFAKQVLRGER
jgi:hypothetical protein